MLTYIVVSCESHNFGEALISFLGSQANLRITVCEPESGITIKGLIVDRVEASCARHEFDKLDSRYFLDLKPAEIVKRRGTIEYILTFKGLCFKQLLLFAEKYSELIAAQRWTVEETNCLPNTVNDRTVPIYSQKFFVAKTPVTLHYAISSAQKKDDAVKEYFRFSISDLTFGAAFKIEATKLLPLMSVLLTKKIVRTEDQGFVWKTRNGITITFRAKPGEIYGLCLISTSQDLYSFLEFVKYHLPYLALWGIYWLRNIEPHLCLISRSEKAEPLDAILERNGFM